MQKFFKKIVVFFRDLKTPKGHFEINRPLEGAIKEFWGFKATLFVVIELMVCPKRYV